MPQFARILSLYFNKGMIHEVEYAGQMISWNYVES